MANEDDIKESLQKSLPIWMPRAGKMETIIEAGSKGIAELSHDFDEVKRATDVQTANTKPEITKLRQASGLVPRSGETVDQYRTRALTSTQKIARAGFPSEILNFTSELLQVDIESIRLSNKSGGVFRMRVPSGGVKSTTGSIESAVELLEDVTASSYGVELIKTGTLEYISETEYENNNYDTSVGYATLDSNGDVTSGGTYSGQFTN